MSNTSDFGKDTSDDGRAVTQLHEDSGIARRLQAMEYMVLAIKDGRQITLTFTCRAGERLDKLREEGVDLDNDRFALKSRPVGGRWTEAIGDAELKAELKSLGR